MTIRFQLISFQLVSLKIDLPRFLKICFIEKIQNVLIYIAYMQGELNISSIYRFMLCVSCIEELDISSLCDTRV